MGFKSDIEIAQETTMSHIRDIAATAGIDEKYLEQYGNYKAKVDYNMLTEKADTPDGKLILVTAISPTPEGEGKTTTTVGLADGLKKIGKNVVVALPPAISAAIPVWSCWTAALISLSLIIWSTATSSLWTA